MSGQVINRREQQKQHTRAALEAAAMELFAGQGYEHTTIEEIAAQAGVSMRTFFRYFSSKQHVLFGDVAHTRISVLGERLEARPRHEHPLDSVRAVLDDSDITSPQELEQIRARLALLRRQPNLMSAYLLINFELKQRIAQFVADRMGVSATHFYPLLVSAAASAAWDAALWTWAEETGDDLGTLRRAAFARLSSGIGKDV